MDIRNDVGGFSELPPGRYRVRVDRTWHDYETGGRAAGTLLDPADIETSREAGTTGYTAEHYREKYPDAPGLAAEVADALASFDPSKVYFPLSDFEKEEVT